MPKTQAWIRDRPRLSMVPISRCMPATKKETQQFDRSIPPSGVEEWEGGGGVKGYSHALAI